MGWSSIRHDVAGGSYGQLAEAWSGFMKVDGWKGGELGGTIS
jgi:hypothetical protein